LREEPKEIYLTFVLCLVENIDFEKNDFKKTVLYYNELIINCHIGVKCLIHSVTIWKFEAKIMLKEAKSIILKKH
jgi:hypothetical protein